MTSKRLIKKYAYRVIDELQTYERFNAVGYDAKLARKVVYYDNLQPSGYKERGISGRLKMLFW